MSSIRMWPASSTTPGQPARLTSCYARDLQQQQQQQLLLHLKQQRESRLLAFLAAQDEAALAQSSATAAAAAWKMTSLSGSSLITKRQGSTSTKTTRAFASTARDLYDERQQPSLQNVAVHEEQPEEQAGSAPRSPANSPPPRPRSENCELAGDDNRDGSTATNWEQMPRDMIPSSTSTSTPTGGAIHRRSSDPRRSTRNRSTEHPPRLRNMNGSGDEDERLQEAVPTPAAVADSETHGYPSNDGVRAPGAAAVDEDREEAERKAEVRAARARRQRNRRKRDRAFQAARKALVKKVRYACKMLLHVEKDAGDNARKAVEEIDVGPIYSSTPSPGSSSCPRALPSRNGLVLVAKRRKVPHFFSPPKVTVSMQLTHYALCALLHGLSVFSN